jgi:hypothetical protein
MNSSSDIRHERECPWCAERILVKAKVCRFCNRDVAPLVEGNSPATDLQLGEQPNIPPFVYEKAVVREPLPVEPSGALDAAPSMVPEAKMVEPRPQEPHTSAVAGTPPEKPAKNPPEVPSTRIASPKLKTGRLHRGEVPLEDLEGMGGWLAWFTLGQIVVVLTGLVALWSDFQDLATWNARGMIAMEGFFTYVMIYDTLSTLIVMGSALLLVLLLRLHPATPRIALYVLGCAVVLYGAQAGLMGLILSRTSSGDETWKAVNDLFISAGRGTGYSLIWLMYWRRSRRVLATFGSNAEHPRAFDVPMTKAVQRFGLITSGVVLVIVVVAIARGMSEARKLSAGLSDPTASAGAPVNDDALIVHAIRSQGGNADSLFLAHKGNDFSWIGSLASAAMVTDLRPEERREVAQFRAMILERLPVDSCASATMTNRGYSYGVLTPPERRRMFELSGIAIGRRISGRYPSEHISVPKERGTALLQQYATAADMQLLGMLSDPKVTPQQTCEAGKAIYRTYLDIRTGTQDERDAVFYLVDILSGR